MKVLATIAGVSLTLFGTLPALAQAGGYYVATPKGEIAKTSFITRSALWKCADGVCSAGKVAERDAVLCEVVARKVGALSAFTVAGTAYGEESLAKCNAKAK
ncbi:MAG: hypothetical protein V4537_02085 [Pseudomonadota bacterium]